MIYGPVITKLKCLLISRILVAEKLRIQLNKA